MSSHRNPNTSVPRLLILIAALSCTVTTAGAKVGNWQSLGPEGGTVFAFAIDPTNSATVYMGASGGLYKSTDGGATWAIRSPGLTSPSDITNIEPFILRIDPHAPSTLYAGVIADLTFSDGVFQSTDGGDTWTGLGLYRERVLSLVQDPSAPSTLYAGTSHGVFKSTDHGESWTAINDGLIPASGTGLLLVTALAIDPEVPTTVYTGTEPFRMYKSNNGGGSWSTLSVGLPAGGGGVNAIAVDPEDPSNVLIVNNNIGIYRSTDSGATWFRALAASVLTDLQIHPLDGTIYAAGDRVFKSTDRGQSWHSLDEGLPVTFRQVNALGLDPTSSSVVYIGDSQESGVAKSTDGGASWELRNHGLRSTTVDALDIYGSTIFAATFNGVYKSTDRRTSWSLANTGLEYPAQALAIDPRNPETVYAGTLRGVCKTIDGGISWKLTNGGMESEIRALAMDPASSSVIYAGAADTNSSGGVYKTTDAGESWDHLVAGLTDRNVGVLAAADSSTIYAGTFGGGGVFKSTDGGATWNVKNDGLPADEEQFTITDLAVDPSDPQVLYVGTWGQGIGKTIDGAETWFPVNYGITDGMIEALIVDPADASVYAGTFFHGVFRSTDGGASWTPFNHGLTQRSVAALDLNATGDLYIGTRSGGVFYFQPCASPTSLCLENERFRVEVEWGDFTGRRGPGQVVPFGSADSGLFWFFEPDNWEMLVKVLDGCLVNGRFWVFAAATTNVETTLRVTDIQTGVEKEYHNPLGHSAAAITDTSAFATCP